MRSWNVHAWYCVSILLALLIGTVSVEWNDVPRLPEIIAFALGLSSLLLAIFTIVQSLTATNDAAASLSAVRQAAEDIGVTGRNLATAADDLKLLSGSMIQSSEAGRSAIVELKEEISSKTKLSTTPPASIPKIAGTIDIGKITYGGAGALYIAARALKKGVSVRVQDVLGENEDAGYEEGYLDALRATNYVQFTKEDEVLTFSRLETDPDTLMKSIRNLRYSKAGPLGTITARLDKIDSFFDKKEDSVPEDYSQ